MVIFTNQEITSGEKKAYFQAIIGAQLPVTFVTFRGNLNNNFFLNPKYPTTNKYIYRYIKI